MDENQELNQNQYNPHPFQHILGMGLGAGTAYYGFSRARRAISPADYSSFKKQRRELNAIENTNPEQYTNGMNKLKSNPQYGAFRKARILKGVGLLGAGVTAYNTYKTVSSDLNTHPVLNNI